MMARTVLSALAMAFAVFSGCGGNDQFLQEPPPSPPGPQRYQKIYKMDVDSSLTYATDVNILWVIDNSGSMSNYQARVIANSDQFMQSFTSSSKLHWKMGLISTTDYEQPYMGFDSVVDYQTVDAIGKFNTAVGRLGTNGSSTEKSFIPVTNVLNQYHDWIRPGAYLVLIMVSDEVEQSYSISTEQFINDMVSRVGGDAQKFAAFGVYVQGGSNTFGNTKYDDVVRLTGGKTYDLSSSDYGTLLAQLGQDLVTRTSSLVPEVMLDQIPVPETIRVSYKGRNLRPGPVALGGEWTYDPQFNVIRINNGKIIDNRQPNVTVSFVVYEKPVTP